MSKLVKFLSKEDAIDRRSFLKISGLLGLGLTAVPLAPLTAEAVRFNRSEFKVSKARLAMGTVVSMTLIHSSRDRAEEAMGKAFEEIDRLTGLMSRFDERTAIAQLNLEGRLNDIPPEAVEVIAKALDYYRLTQGAFDITVKPVVDLFKAKLGNGNSGTPPTEKELKEALALVGADQVQMNGRRIFFKKPGMGITLDGIAKGYIVDKASRVLSEKGIENHLINAGGDIRTRGKASRGRPWTVAVQDPSKKGEYPAKIRMNDGAIATSGNYEIYFDREKMFHHIVDPKTGHSPFLSTSVSVLAQTAMEADALATGVFVMAPEKGTRFISSLPLCESLVLGKDGSRHESRGWRNAAI